MPTEKFSVIQKLVKQHNLRFCGHIIKENTRTYITLSGAVLDFNAFNFDYTRLTTNITEKKSSMFKRVIRMLKGRVINFIN